MNLQTVADISGHLAYILFALAFLMRNIVYLRLWGTLASFFFIFYGYFHDPKNPLWVDIFWDGMFAAVNIIQLLILTIENYQEKFKDETEEFLYQTVFKCLTRSEFKKLMKFGTLLSAEKGTVLIQEGTPVNSIMVIVKGIANIKVNNATVASCRAGNFIGEMSLMTGRPPIASVETNTPLDYIKWEKENLGKFLENDLRLKHAIQSILTRDLVKKLIPQS